MHNEVGQGVSVGLGKLRDGLIHGTLGVSRVGVPGCVHENLKSLDAINCMSARNSAIGRKICGIPFFLCYCGLYAFARDQNIPKRNTYGVSQQDLLVIDKIFL